MCGIAGLIAKNGRSLDQDRLIAMAGKIAHRGPDGEGMWVEGQAGLAHRRLALVDLSPSGAQPMVSEDGRFVVTFNGEIYNYKELRSQLSGVRFQSQSDTEILLTLFAQEGEAMLTKLRGMFAFAIWDKQESRLFFARDRIGKKPFFYKHSEQEFAFASEVKSLVDGESQIDAQAIRLFLGLQYVPSPLTGFKNIFSLEPGMCGTWKDGFLTTRSYLERVSKPDVSFDDAAHEVRRILDESVRLRLIADVPVGIFLSGGIDSSAIAALAHKQGAKLSSFTLGFDEAAFDERDQAAELAKKFGFEHHAFLAKPEDLLAISDDAIEHYDVPYADSSSLNTWILARETKKYTKAVLTGDGGDELFGGYRRYRYFEQALQLKKLGLGIPAGFVSRIASDMTGDKRFDRFADAIDGGYAALFCGAYFQQPEAIEFINKRLKKELDPIGAAMDFDLRSYLPDDLNVKMDRATMRHGLEARCPLLDQELVAYVTSLPTEYRYKKGQTKRLFVEAVKDLLPAEIGKRGKRGFQVPLAIWFRGALRSAFVERCVNSSKLHAYIKKERVEKLLSENDRGSDHGNRLWMLYSLATWLEKYG
jgi:asparagine synthase (glutamine-hydrolysing)